MLAASALGTWPYFAWVAFPFTPASFLVRLTEENHRSSRWKQRGRVMLARAKNYVIVRALLIAALCVFAFDTTGGQARVTIERNRIWNDLIVRFKNLHGNIEIVGNFLVDHQTEY